MALFEALEEENKELKRVNAYLLKIVETATKYVHFKETPLIKDQIYEQNMYNHLVKLIEKRERDLR